MNSRCCSRTACKQSPVYTLTYVYKDSTAVLGPLAGYVDPHSWDLCEMHAARLVVPRGWDVVRLPPDPAQERADDLEALANIVRDVGRSERAAQPRPVAQPRQAPRPPLPPPPRSRSARASRSAAVVTFVSSAPPPPRSRSPEPAAGGGRVHRRPLASRAPSFALWRRVTDRLILEVC